jgi:hypothetical protein
VYTLQTKYDCVIFELAIRAFDIQSGWRDAFERQREYMRRDLFIGTLEQACSSGRYRQKVTLPNEGCCQQVFNPRRRALWLSLREFKLESSLNV